MFILPIPPSLLWWNTNLFPPLCKEMMTTIVLMRSVNFIMLVWGEYVVRWVWGICGGFRSLMAKCLEPGGTTVPMPVVNIHLLRFYLFQFTPQVREVIAVAYYSIIFFLKRISPLAYCVYSSLSHEWCNVRSGRKSHMFFFFRILFFQTVMDSRVHGRIQHMIISLFSLGDVLVLWIGFYFSGHLWMVGTIYHWNDGVDVGGVRALWTDRRGT